MGIEIAVCDSDREIANELKKWIALYKPETYAKTFFSADALLRYKEFFDIYFLDIKGISGLELAHQIRQREKLAGAPRSILIFATGFSDYMADAFDVQAFHYLIKPIKEEKFREVLEKAMEEAKTKRQQEEAYILLRIPSKKKKVLLRNVLYVESSNKKVLVHTTEGTYEVQGKMEDFEQSLGDTFYRSHRCYLVNFSHISSYGKNEIELVNGDRILLAYKKYSSFVKSFLAYAKKGGLVNV